MRSRLGIRARFVGFALTVALAGVTAVSVTTAISTRRVLIDHQDRILTAAANRSADGLRDFIVVNMDLLRTEAQIQALADCLQADRAGRDGAIRCVTEASDLLRRLSLRDDIYVESYALLDKTGRTVADSVAARAGQMDHSTEAIERALVTGLPQVTFIPPGPQERDSPYVAFLSAVRSAAGESVGVLRVRYHLAVIQGLIARDTSLLGGRGTVMVLDGDGRFIAEGADAEWILTPLAERWPNAAADMQRLSATPESLDLAGIAEEASRVAASEVGWLGWRVVAAQPLSEFLAPVWTSTRVVVVVAILVALLAGLGAMVAAERFARPIARLTRHAERVAAGDLEAQANVEGPREIATLGEAFGEMTRRVRELLQGLQREVDERTRAEEATRESEARQRAILENALDIVYAHDAQGVVLFMSPSIERWLGITPDSVVGRAVRELVHPDDRPKMPEWRTATEGGAAVHMQTVRWRHADGTWHPLETASRNALDVAGVEAVIVSARDVTERERAAAHRQSLEASLAQARSLEAIGLLAGGVAHDLNNLLMPILGYTDLVLADLHPEASERQHLTQVHDAAQRARDLVQQLLAFGRRQRLDVRAIDMGQEILGMETLLRTSLTERIRLELRLSDTPVVIAADAAEFQRVVMNLAINARDAMPSGGRLQIEVGPTTLDGDQAVAYDLPPGTYGQLVVRDTGHGMDPQTRAHAFEPFFSTKERGRGTGLGLASVFGVVRQHRGGIRVDSAPDAGTCFDVLWPLAASAVTASAPPGRPIRGSGEIILLVEDDPSVRDIVRLTLEGAGYRTLPAGGADEAMSHARNCEAPVRLLVSDVVMPGTSGPALFEMLRQEGLVESVLFMSGYADDSFRGPEQLPPGATVLTKPFSPAVLLRWVSEALARSSQPPSSVDEEPRA